MSCLAILLLSKINKLGKIENRMDYFNLILSDYNKIKTPVEP